ncbi:DUF3795 domain-containing protein [Candidatus Bathyarchaeota archaeon]|nr:DUF3795 domain-containing protein [Candidatus Bathyarchaeota archaeon]
MQGKAFENVKNQIGYCGLWCGSCIVGNGALKELTKKYEHLIRGYGVNDWGAKDFDGKEFMKGLASIQVLPICPGCLKGGGNDECKIRPCASGRKVSDCTVCNEFMKCSNSEALQKVRTGAAAVGMLMKTDKDKADQQQLIEKWTEEVKDNFPHCILFSQSQH